jgi:cytochrome c-type biogenesis protein CcmF
MRIQYKPLVRYIWLGAIIMALGGLLAATDRRYRVKATADAAQPSKTPRAGRAELGTV